MESGVSGQQLSRRVDRFVKQLSPSFMVVCMRHCGFSFFFFERFCCSKKEANSLHSGLIANGRARRQGRRGMPFIGEKRKPLTEEARDRAQPLAEKGICGGTVRIAEGSELVSYRFCVAFDLLHVSVGKSGCRRSCV